MINFNVKRIYCTKQEFKKKNKTEEKPFPIDMQGRMHGNILRSKIFCS